MIACDGRAWIGGNSQSQVPCHGTFYTNLLHCVSFPLFSGGRLILNSIRRQKPVSIEVTGPPSPDSLSSSPQKALEFVADLNGEFNPRHKELLGRRHQFHDEIQSGKRPTFLEETRAVRVGDWQIAPLPDDLQDRRSEITGPVDRKMMINALNSGACVFMADLEDSNTPHWHNQIQRQINLRDAYDRSISFTNPEGKHYALKGGRLAVMLILPRGLHMEEKHLLVEGESSSGSPIWIWACTSSTIPSVHLTRERGRTSTCRKSKVTWRLGGSMRSSLGRSNGSIKATVLIETILAAFVDGGDHPRVA